MNNRKINWLESACRSIEAEVPKAACVSEYLADRLTALLLERLPAPVGTELLALLPEHEFKDREGQRHALEACAHSPGDASIGFHDFIVRAQQAMGVFRSLDLPKDDESAQKVAEVFLWSFALPLTSETKEHITEALPSELKWRMGLGTSPSDESKVA